jgi:very-short-patch-repair endonuclease
MKFKRQALIGRYIVDFVSFQRRLAIEVDGGQHADSEADLRRTRWLEGQGFRILRFWNNEVLSNTGGVLDAIMVAGTNPSPRKPLRGAPPSPTRGEGKNDSEF